MWSLIPLCDVDLIKPARRITPAIYDTHNLYAIMLWKIEDDVMTSRHRVATQIWSKIGLIYAYVGMFTQKLKSLVYAVNLAVGNVFICYIVVVTPYLIKVASRRAG